MNQSTIKKIRRLFNFKDLSYIGKAKGGFLSDNYILLNGSQKLFLKQYRPSVHNKLQSVANAEDFFSDKGIPVLKPIKVKGLKSFFKIKDDYFSLYPFIKAKVLGIENEVPTTKTIQSIAANLALMHSLTKSKHINHTKTLDREWDARYIFSKKKKENFLIYATKIISLINQKKYKSNFDRDTLKILNLKLKISTSIPTQFNSSSLGKPHLIHGDYHAQNLFLDKTGEVLYVFDFDKTQVLPRSLEVIRSLFYICFNGKFTNKEFKLAQEYLKSYQNIYPITKSELESAIRFIYYKHTLNLWIEAGHYLNNFTRADILLPRELSFLTYLSKNIDRFIKKVLNK